MRNIPHILHGHSIALIGDVGIRDVATMLLLLLLLLLPLNWTGDSVGFSHCARRGIDQRSRAKRLKF